MFWEIIGGCFIAALIVTLFALIFASVSFGFFSSTAWLVTGRWLVGAFAVFVALAIVGLSELFEIISAIIAVLIFGLWVGDFEGESSL